jgi:hypothetical protein
MGWFAGPVIALGVLWFSRSFWKWRRKQIGDANELDCLDEIVREHTSGRYDHTNTIRRMIHDIEQSHEPSAALARELRRAREALEKKEAAN